MIEKYQSDIWYKNTRATHDTETPGRHMIEKHQSDTWYKNTRATHDARTLGDA